MLTEKQRKSLLSQAEDMETCGWVDDAQALRELLAAHSAGVRADEPIAYEFQHDETGRTTFVDPWQVEQGFAANNPRWQLIGPVFRHARAAAPSPDREQAWEGKMKFIDQAQMMAMRTASGPELHAAMNASPSRECGEQQGAALSEVDERKAFEAWLPTIDTHANFSRHIEYGYDDWDVELAWAGWRHRAILAASAPTLGEQSPSENHECVYQNGDGTCRECEALAKRARVFGYARALDGFRITGQTPEDHELCTVDAPGAFALYTAPVAPQPQAAEEKGLTDEQVKNAFYTANCKSWYDMYPSAAMDVARALLAKGE